MAREMPGVSVPDITLAISPELVLLISLAPSVPAFVVSWRMLTARAARLRVFMFLLLIVVAEVIALVLSIYGDAPRWLPLAPTSLFAITLLLPNQLVKATGGPRPFEALVVTTTWMSDELRALGDDWFGAGSQREAAFDRDEWRRNVERWRQPDTAAYVDQYEAMLAAWPRRPVGRIEALADAADAIDAMKPAMNARFVASGADHDAVRGVLGYQIAIPDTGPRSDTLGANEGTGSR